MIRLGACAACLLLASACSDSPASNGTGAGNVAAPAAADSRMPRAGRYVVRMEREQLGSAKPGRLEQLENVRCIAGGETLPNQILKAGVGAECSAQDLEAEKGRIVVLASCPADPGMPPLTLEGRGSYSPEGWELTIDFSVEGRRLRGTESARRTGDC